MNWAISRHISNGEWRACDDRVRARVVAARACNMLTCITCIYVMIDRQEQLLQSLQTMQSALESKDNETRQRLIQEKQQLHV